MFKKSISISEVDSEIANVIKAEEKRQEEHIELIASENYTSPAVMAAQGSQLTNKYAEGYPNKRYYGGCEHVDVAEQLAIQSTCGHGLDFSYIVFTNFEKDFPKSILHLFNGFLSELSICKGISSQANGITIVFENR